MRNRVVIENIQPQLDGGRYFIKRVPGERVDVTADIFPDGHDYIRAFVLFREMSKKTWNRAPMTALGNDRWAASFTPDATGMYEYTVEAWLDHLLTWRNGFKKKYEDGQHMAVELQIGANLLRQTAKLYPKTKTAPINAVVKMLEDKKGYQEAVAAVLSLEFEAMVYEYPLRQHVSTPETPLRLRVGRPQERFTTWYEFFPRSASEIPGKHGTFKDAKRLLPRLAEMGFDVLYLPPIHPIGKLNRKGRNNAVTADPGDPGSPWAIGNEEGGHKDIHAELGTLADYQDLIREAAKYEIEIALDLAFQCAPDHPYIKEHPDWFLWRPDGTIAYAENPPKKYQDIVPINFETDDWENLWNELLSVVLYWADKGVKIFRVDNPHTKPFPFWEWLIGKAQEKYPDLIFLAEAFTRPRVMNNLAKLGFTQSYSYFIWRNSKQEMETYLNEISQTEMREYMRPNFWPNTPDILPYELMGAGSNAFTFRLLLAATLSSNYGLYGPVYEMCENRPNDNGKEEYYFSEKYEIKRYDWNMRNRLTDAMTRVNWIRRENPALQDTYNIHFTRTDSDHLMSFVKMSPDRRNIIWCVANWDTRNTRSGYIEVPKHLFGLEGRQVRMKVTDLLTRESYHWFNDWNYVEINPFKWPMHIFRVEF